MSSLITSDTELLLAPAWRAPPSPQLPVRDPELERLEVRIRDLEAALQESDVAAADAIARARAEAREESEAAFVRDEETRLAIVEVALREAVSMFKSRLTELDSLALLISETALETVFARPDDHKALIGRAIEMQISAIHRDALVGLKVSPADFADDAALEALSRRVGGAEVSIDRELASGEARLIVRLGEIEVSIPRHWASLQRKLRELGGEDQSL